MRTKVHLYITSMFSVFPSHKPDSITTIYIFLGIINNLREFKKYTWRSLWGIFKSCSIFERNLSIFRHFHLCVLKPGPHRDQQSAIFTLLLVTVRGPLSWVSFTSAVWLETQLELQWSQVNLIKWSHSYLYKSEMLESSKLKDV